MGSISVRQGTERTTLRMILLVDPEVRGKIEGSLVQAALQSLSHRKVQLILDYPAGVAQSELEALGFQPQRTLTWMAKEFSESSV